jgi:ribonuclease-3
MPHPIEEILGHRFLDARLLQEALTHPGRAETVGGVPFNYQRLEFLGDAVLGMLTAELLHRLYPLENEGNLAKRQAGLVRGETLARIARDLGLGAYILLHASEEQGGGRANDSNLEDVCEALIGALYLDAGCETARRFVWRWWEEPARAALAPPRDAKTALQEWVQARGLPLPQYRLEATSGPAHAPEFTIAALLADGRNATAKAPAKRQAEQMAAQALLEILS